MARHFVSRGAERLPDLRIELQRATDRERGQWQATLAEQVQQAPDARARTVLIHALDTPVALCLARRPAGQFVQVRFGAGIAVEHGGFRAFLDVQHKLYRHTRGTRPMRMGRGVSVAGQIAGWHHPSSKVVMPKIRACTRPGSGPRYMRAQPNTSVMPCRCASAMAAG
ncbi:hypothetical protein D3C72_1692010 [compost metagenome]